MREITEKPLIPEGYPSDRPLPPRHNGKISYEDFFEWADEDTHAEWVDGEIDILGPVRNRHQQLVLYLADILSRFVRLYDLGEVRLPMQMKLEKSGREPDVLFVAKTNLAHLLPTRLTGPADLVIEVVSPEKRDRKRDRVTKFQEYAEGKVPEYWLIDYTKDEAIFYQLDEKGQYQEISLDDAGKYHSAILPGFWLKPAWLWREELPSVDRILKELAGQAYLDYFARQLECTMQRTIRLQLNISSPSQAQILTKTLQDFTLVFNQVSSYGWENNERNGVKLHHATYYQVKEVVKSLPTQLICAARVKATEALKSAFALLKLFPDKIARFEAKRAKALAKGKPFNRRPPHPPSQPHSQLCPIRYDRRSYWVNWARGEASLATAQGRQLIGFSVPSYYHKYTGYPTASADLIYKKGQFWLHVVVNLPDPR